MPQYYFECDQGCGIRFYASMPSARKRIREEVGTANGLKIIREATEEDIVWVRAMGGKVETNGR